MQEFKCNKPNWIEIVAFLALKAARELRLCPQALVLDCFRGSWVVLLATFTVVIRPAEASDLRL